MRFFKIVAPLAAAAAVLVIGFAGPARANGFVEVTDTVAPFRDVCRLFVTPTVLARWSDDDLIAFQNLVIDADSSTGDDLFSRVWEYLCHGDRDPAFDRIDVAPYGRPERVDRIEIRLYHRSDTPGRRFPTIELPNRLFVDGARDRGRMRTPEQIVLGHTLAHELAHLIFRYNHDRIDFGGGWADEFHATAAEYLIGYRWPNAPVSNVYYDTSFLTNRRYNMARLFFAYLMTHFAGGPGAEDDALHRWVRPGPGGRVDYQLAGLGAVLAGHPDAATLRREPAGGERESGASANGDGEPGPSGSGDALVGALFHRYALARHANERERFDGVYGFGPGVDVASFRMFDWPDTNGEHVRSAAPHFAVGAAPVETDRFLGTRGAMSEACRTRELGMRRWAAEYLVLRGEPGLRPGALLVTLDPMGPLPDGTVMRVGYLGYDVTDSLLADDRPVEIVEAVASPGTGSVRFTVPGFGHRIRAVVVVASLVPDPIPPFERHCSDPFCGPYQATNPCDDCDPGRGPCREPEARLKLGYRME